MFWREPLRVAGRVWVSAVVALTAVGTASSTAWADDDGSGGDPAVAVADDDTRDDDTSDDDTSDDARADDDASSDDDTSDDARTDDDASGDDDSSDDARADDDASSDDDSSGDREPSTASDSREAVLAGDEVAVAEIDGVLVAVGAPPVPPAKVIVAVGQPPVPPAEIIVAVGQPPVPPAGVIVAVGKPPVPPAGVIVAVGKPPVPPAVTAPSREGDDAAPRMPEFASAVLTEGQLPAVALVSDALSRLGRSL
ncbi:MAG: hypothetical protein QNJ12_14830 [Ilumatobacter sp.]|uniref:hypothetical protein n=1 Tax=Ilumatobacter sp. TaxID=1967498 RepID=UPI002639F4F0|nr:hypothetical protein [Ilumatobacter sp.]MDJ0770073.1 hypothetical protein [Ilumatobacter sp.]